VLISLDTGLRGVAFGARDVTAAQQGAAGLIAGIFVKEITVNTLCVRVGGSEVHASVVTAKLIRCRGGVFVSCGYIDPPRVTVNPVLSDNEGQNFLLGRVVLVDFAKAIFIQVMQRRPSDLFRFTIDGIGQRCITIAWIDYGPCHHYFHGNSSSIGRP
jgi:hypothetical protein